MLNAVLRTCLIILFLSFALNVYADNAFTHRQDVQSFIQLMVKKHQFNKQALTTTLAAVKVRPQVIQHMNRPLEKEPWRTYQMLFVNEWRIQHGLTYWKKHAEALKRAQDVYGVPPGIIVATIGIETRYGERIGEYRVIDSLSSIAFSHSPRANFFKKELEEFLLLTREQHLDPLKVMGSYAGAIGAPQFMPSSYRAYAVNFSKSGKIDLMHNQTDVIGSIANYYKKHGWITNDPVAVQAYIIGDRYHYLLRTNKIAMPATVAELGKYGVIPKNKLSQEKLLAKVIELKSHFSKEFWLGFHNFDVIKRYNASDLYAMAVFQLNYYMVELKNRLDKG